MFPPSAFLGASVARFPSPRQSLRLHAAGLGAMMAERRKARRRAAFAPEEMIMAELRHIAMSVRDPWLTAEFYKRIFGFEGAGETDSSLAEGTFISDGVFGMALLDFKSEEAAQGKGKNFVGLHHFGIWVDDIEATRKRIERAGGQWLMGEPDYRHNAQYEVKFLDINGVVLDLVHNGWAG